MATFVGFLDKGNVMVRTNVQNQRAITIPEPVVNEIVAELREKACAPCPLWRSPCKGIGNIVSGIAVEESSIDKPVTYDGCQILTTEVDVPDQGIIFGERSR